jgi:thiol-disulfide isomerase/thioredoxin
VRNDGQESAEARAEELEKHRVTITNRSEKFPFELIETEAGEALSGKYVLVNMFATWCPYCGKEKPSLERLHEKYGNEGLTVFGVSVGETAETVAEYMREGGYTFPVGMNRDGSLREKYAPRLPTSYVVDGGGKIVARINGDKEWDSEEMVRILRLLVPGLGEE